MSKNQYACSWCRSCCINWTESKLSQCYPECIFWMQGPVVVSLLLDSSEHISHALLLWKVWRVPPWLGLFTWSPGHMWASLVSSSPLRDQDLQRSRAQGKPGWEAQKFYNWVCGFSSETKLLPPWLQDRIFWLRGKIAPLCFKYTLYPSQHVQYPLRLHPTLSGCWLHLTHLSLHQLSLSPVSFQSLTSCF